MNGKMKWILLVEKQGGRDRYLVLPICGSCIDGDHSHYGGVSDCKYVEVQDGANSQCVCGSGWPELTRALEERSYIGPCDDRDKANLFKPLPERDVGGGK